MEESAVKSNYFVVQYEPGAEHPALPTWGNRQENVAALAEIKPGGISKKMLTEVPGAFQLLNVLTPDECKRLISASESMGFLPDAAVSLPRSVRHNDSLTWVVDNTTERLIWNRIQALMTDDGGIFEGKAALGLNNRFRFYRYNPGDYFKPHSDGSWPGSQVLDDQLVHDAFGDRYSQLTFLILLTEDFEGGATRFLVNADHPDKPAKRGDNVRQIDVRTPAGSVLCFPHGMHPLHCIHSSEPILSGVKYIIRSDVLFEL
ncbi:MAG: putative 2-oxoglutarate/Fe(II)-dependent dioxygenase YbiX [Psychromonas sp.]|jgi:predicted 2-oxoglutarate/Fe(II)-dependent dioxygenase YbiX|uniref:prolyl hydroxylase family protein n=1 Tax=Psychromonas sp. TaxID=1884585 RepID=UPI0039E33BFE